MKFYLNEDLPKFVLSEKFILNEAESEEKTRQEILNELEPSIEDFNKEYNNKKDAFIANIIAFGEKATAADALTEDAESKLKNLEENSDKAILPDLTKLIDQLQNKNQHKLDDIPEIKNYLDAVKNCSVEVAYFSNKKDEEIDKIKTDLIKNLKAIETEYNNYKKEVSRIDRQIKLLKTIDAQMKFLLSKKSIFENFVKKLQEKSKDLIDEYKQQLKAKAYVENFANNKLKNFFARLKKETSVKYLESFSKTLNNWLHWKNGGQEINLTDKNLTLQEFIDLTAAIENQITDDLTREKIAWERETGFISDWEKAFIEAASKDGISRRKTGESAVAKVMDKYLDQEWKVKSNRDIRQAISKIYDNFMLELESLGYTAKTNPFVSYLHYAFDTMNAAKEIEKNANAYSALHEAYRRNLIDKNILEGNWSVDVNGATSKIGRDSIIFCKDFYNLQRQDIYRYLEYQLSVPELFDQFIKNTTNSKKLIIDHYSNNFTAFFVDLFYKPGNPLEQEAGISGADGKLKPLDMIRNELSAVFGDKTTQDTIEKIREQGAKQEVNNFEKINANNLKDVIEKITNNKHWSVLTNDAINKIIKLSSAIIKNLAVEDYKAASKIKQKFDDAKRQGLITRSLEDLSDEEASATSKTGVIKKLSAEFGYNFASIIKNPNLCEKLFTGILETVGGIKNETNSSEAKK